MIYKKYDCIYGSLLRMFLLNFAFRIDYLNNYFNNFIYKNVHEILFGQGRKKSIHHAGTIDSLF